MHADAHQADPMNVLERARLVKGLAPSDVAKLLEVSSNSVRGWERGTRRPRAELIPKIAEVYALDAEAVVDAINWDTDGSAESEAR